jgi:hypothetical protein
LKRKETMKALPTNDINTGVKQRSAGRWIVPGLVFFLAGVALTAAWFYRGAWSHAATGADAARPGTALSGATRAVLQNMDSPVEIRLYTMLDAASVPESVQAFAGRVDQLVGQYEQASGGRVRVTRCSSFSTASANAAQADGIKGFNMDKGDSCFLGIAVVCGDGKESLPQLAPEWEQAVEPDLTRAIVRAVASRPGAQPVARADTASLDAVRKAIPNLDAVSIEDGRKVLRDASQAQFIQTMGDMNTQIEDAEQRFLQAVATQSEAAQQAASEQIQKIQKERSRKLQQIAFASHAQMAALEQLKKTAP